MAQKDGHTCPHLLSRSQVTRAAWLGLKAMDRPTQMFLSRHRFDPSTMPIGPSSPLPPTQPVPLPPDFLRSNELLPSGLRPMGTPPPFQTSAQTLSLCLREAAPFSPAALSLPLVMSPASAPAPTAGGGNPLQPPLSRSIRDGFSSSLSASLLLGPLLPALTFTCPVTRELRRDPEHYPPHRTTSG